jgi:OOP family OmpA-OmpF porin
MLIQQYGFAQQNLVINPSFEDGITPTQPLFYLENFIYQWHGGFGYFNTNRVGDFGVPNNEVGHQYPYTGNAYTGIYTSMQSPTNLRQYIQSKLIVPLQNGLKYKVSFYVSLADTIHAYNNSIGAYFTTDSFFVSYYHLIIQTPQIKNDSSHFLNNKTEWTLVCDTLIASGGEKWITIGNFLSESLNVQTPLDSVCFQPNPYACAAYYYIDDVSVTVIDETGMNEQKQNRFSLFPNPNTGNFKLQYDGIVNKAAMLFITNVYGENIDSKEVESNSTNFENTSLNNGVYFYNLRQGNEEIGRGKFVVVK